MPGFELLGREEEKQILDVLSRGVLFRYEFQKERRGVYKVRQFEQKFAAHHGAKYGLAVSSGSAALKVALAGLGVGPGDEVVVPGFTFVASWEAVLDAGATPVFAEIDDTLNLDPKLIEQKIGPRTRAVICVHMLGAPARIDKIARLCRQSGVPLIEDTAQAAGGTFKGKGLGTFGTCGTFSFDSVKTVTTGEGGLVITNDQDLHVTASEYHDHGHDHAPVGRGNEGRRFFGFNFRMMELQGALGLAQLKKLPRMLRIQRQNKAALKEGLAGIKGLRFRRVPDTAGDTATFLSWFMPDAGRAAAMNQALAKRGAGAVHWQANTWHAFPCWEHLHAGATPIASGWPYKRGRERLKYRPDDLPQTAHWLGRCLSWPIGLKMPKKRLTQMVEAAHEAAAEVE
ncbi:MAG: DegT/DnrJ/EryC1/StrS family aminotransferase [Proteobacteria bacterium]|nr:DegT/DnrJ/EryC1/StrS family aminotransferase [Pseudomonadota bacterium]